MIGRPHNEEAAPDYFNYINLAVGEDPVAVMETQLDEYLTFFGAITEENSQYRYAPEKWNIRQVLNHISDSERVFAFRTLWFARGCTTPLPSYDQNLATAGAMAERVAWAEHVEEFRCVRRSTLSLYRNMPSEAWMRSGIASDNRFTVRALAFIIAGHALHHIKLLRERYLIQ
jgi:DinB family protein